MAAGLRSAAAVVAAAGAAAEPASNRHMVVPACHLAAPWRTVLTHREDY